MASRRPIQLVKPILYILVGIALLFVILNSFMSFDEKKSEVLRLEKEMEEIEKERDQLQTEVELLNDSDYVTRYARENYIFTRDGEQVIILPDIGE